MRNARRIAATLVLAALILLFATPAFALEQRVFDDAALFTADQAGELEQTIADLREAKNVDIAVVTTADAQGKSSMAYADDYYDQHAFGTGSDLSGALLLIDMDNRQAYISTSGSMIDVLTDARIQSILDDVTPYLKDGDYAGAANAFLSDAKRSLDAGVESGQHRYDTETGEVTRPGQAQNAPRYSLFGILFFLAISAVVGLIIRGSVVSSYRMKTSAYQYPVQEKCALNLSRTDDLFINQTLTSHRIQTSSGSSSGRSSTHTSSGGHTHGGGGRGF